MTGSEVILDRIAQEYAKIDTQTVATYREVFDTPAGRDVLADLLNMLGFYSAVDSTAEEAITASLAKLILAKCGVWHAEKLYSLTRAMMNLPPVVPAREE